MTFNIANGLAVDHFIPTTSLEDDKVQLLIIMATLLIGCLFVRAIVIGLVARALILVILIVGLDIVIERLAVLGFILNRIL